jgi:hypothetical protein
MARKLEHYLKGFAKNPDMNGLANLGTRFFLLRDSDFASSGLEPPIHMGYIFISTVLWIYSQIGSKYYRVFHLNSRGEQRFQEIIGENFAGLAELKDLIISVSTHANVKVI